MSLAELLRKDQNKIILKSGTITTDSNSDDIDFRHWNQGVFVFDVTAISGGTLTLIIKGKDEETGKYETLHTEAITGISTVQKVLPIDYDLIRLEWTITAGQSATFKTVVTSKNSAGWLRTKLATLLPAALTTGGNLKISIQEIAAGLLSNSGLKVALVEKIAGEDLTRKFIRSFAPSVFTVFSASTTIVTGAGNLRGMLLVAGTAGDTITIYDNTADSGTKIMDTYTVETSPVFPKNFDFKDGAFSTGCRITITGTGIKGTVETIGNYS